MSDHGEAVTSAVIGAPIKLHYHRCPMCAAPRECRRAACQHATFIPCPGDCAKWGEPWPWPTR